MEKYLRPRELDLDPDLPNAGREWNRWRNNFSAFVAAISLDLQPDKLLLLKAHIACLTYELIENCSTYDEAIAILNSRYVKPTNVIYARHKLATRLQKVGESLTTFVQNLKSTATECKFEAVSAEVNQNDCIRDAFINGLTSSHIRQRLLENLNLTLDGAISLAQSLDMAQTRSEAYGTNDTVVASMNHENGELKLYKINVKTRRYKHLRLRLVNVATAVDHFIQDLCVPLNLPGATIATKSDIFLMCVVTRKVVTLRKRKKFLQLYRPLRLQMWESISP